MNHGQTTIVIETTAQAEAMLKHLNYCSQAAQADDYASERARPIKWMTCTCCGEGYEGRQWWNQDTGYGAGDCCANLLIEDQTPGVESECYGVSGIHFLIPQAEKDHPPLVVDRGVPLYGLDERLRIEYDGYVFWKGREIEHFSGSRLYDSEESKAAARNLIRRCEALEARGAVVCFNNIIAE